MAISEPARTQELHTGQMRRPDADGVANRYALTNRERRRRHWWWVLALLVAIIVGLITYALAHNRGDNVSNALTGSAIATVPAPSSLSM